MKTPQNTPAKLAIMLASCLLASCTNPDTVKVQVENNFINYIIALVVIILLVAINSKLKWLVEFKKRKHMSVDDLPLLDETRINEWIKNNPGKTKIDYYRHHTTPHDDEQQRIETWLKWHPGKTIEDYYK